MIFNDGATMDVLIIAGSPRVDSQSSRVSKILERYVRDSSVFTPKVLDLAVQPVGVQSNELANMAEAFIIVVPEHSGMAPAVLKEFFISSEYPVLAHKPALIVSISSGLGGSYPVLDLRATTYKNTKICYMPDHLIIRDVHNFDADMSSSAYPGLGRRISACVQMLELYACQLSAVRADLLGVGAAISYGM